MSEYIVIALISASSAVIGGLLTSVVGPLFRHILESRRLEKSRKRDLIGSWRSMVLEIHQNSGRNIDLASDILSHSSFMSLEPYLSEETLKSIYSRQLTVVLGKSMSSQLEKIKKDISKIERDWGLS